MKRVRGCSHVATRDGNREDRKGEIRLSEGLPSLEYGHKSRWLRGYGHTITGEEMRVLDIDSSVNEDRIGMEGMPTSSESEREVIRTAAGGRSWWSKVQRHGI